MVTRAYHRLGVVPLQLALKAIARGDGLSCYGAFCSTASNRLLTYHFYGTNCCVPGCCVTGKYFAVERAINQKTSKYHLNLYGQNSSGQEIMVTSDHRIPKSKGGSNEIDNRQPMCAPHNLSKGNQLIHL